VACTSFPPSNCRNTFYNGLCWPFSTETLPCESSGAQTKKGPTQHTSSSLHSRFLLSGSYLLGLVSHLRHQPRENLFFRDQIHLARREEQQETERSFREAICPEPEWWSNGDPRNKGTMQGNVDVSFRIKGSKGVGTLYFTSIRREKGLPFTILRFKVIADGGQVVEIESKGL
ncbi:DUF1783-domain-containing protein, partial [Dendrothele bispora CBS 962.96]